MSIRQASSVPAPWTQGTKEKKMKNSLKANIADEDEGKGLDDIMPITINNSATGQVICVSVSCYVVNNIGHNVALSIIILWTDCYQFRFL